MSAVSFIITFSPADLSVTWAYAITLYVCPHLLGLVRTTPIPTRCTLSHTFASPWKQDRFLLLQEPEENFEVFLFFLNDLLFCFCFSNHWLDCVQIMLPIETVLNHSCRVWLHFIWNHVEKVSLILDLYHVYLATFIKLEDFSLCENKHDFCQTKSPMEITFRTPQLSLWFWKQFWILDIRCCTINYAFRNLCGQSFHNVMPNSFSDGRSLDQHFQMEEA